MSHQRIGEAIDMMIDKLGRDGVNAPAVIQLSYDQYTRLMQEPEARGHILRVREHHYYKGIRIELVSPILMPRPQAAS